MTPQGTIALENASNAFRPYDEIRGTVSWRLASTPKSLELRLFWFTTGRGTQEAGVVEVQSLPATPSGAQHFSFILPDSPISFSGQLIRLTWALELVAEPQGQLALHEFLLAPVGRLIELPAIPKPKTSWWSAISGNR